MIDAETLDRALARRRVGTRLDRGRGGDEARHKWDAIANAAQALIDDAASLIPGLRPIHFDFIWDGRVNAFAFREGERYFIALTSGAVVALQLVFCRVLADRRALVDVGEPSDERRDLPLLQGLVPDAELMYQAGLSPELPKTRDRQKFAKALFDQALMFLVGHELAHITRGHVDYLNA